MRTRRIKVKRIDGFTLIELLTVVAIIGLLVGMVVPTIKAVLENKQKMQLQVRIRSLDDACNIYKMSATGNRYYPGQDTEGIGALGSTGSANYPNCQNAGSALLARCLFTMIDPNDPAKKLFPVSSYGQLEKDMLGTVTVGSNTIANSSIIDYASETMAILYYPSRLGSKGQTTQYVVSDNSKYVTGATNTAMNTTTNTLWTIQTYVQGSTGTTGATTIVRQDGLFVITAAGTDRLYFSSSSVSNF